MKRTGTGRKLSIIGGAVAMMLTLGAPSGAVARPTGAWEGHYAMELRLATVARVPLIGSERSVTRTLLLVDAWRGNGGWIQRQRVCDVRIDGGSADMSVPGAFVRSIPERQYASQFPGGSGARYVADLGVESFGFDPALTGGQLPRSARAPGVVDSDRDGAPGVTVVGRFPLFGRVRIFFVQRSHLVLDGRTTAPGRIEGGIDVRVLEQRTIGASSVLFRRNVEIRPDPERSSFVLVATPQITSCEQLRAADSSLFGTDGTRSTE